MSSSGGRFTPETEAGAASGVEAPLADDAGFLTRGWTFGRAATLDLGDFGVWGDPAVVWGVGAFAAGVKAAVGGVATAVVAGGFDGLGGTEAWAGFFGGGCGCGVGCCCGG